MGGRVKPYVTAGVALVGASIIAVTPISAAPPPEVRTATSLVQLAAFPDMFENPVVFYSDVVQTAFANTATLTQLYFTDPVPIIRAVLANQAVAISDIVAALVDRDGAALWAATVNAVTRPITNLVAVGAYVIENVGQILLKLALPVISGVFATAFAFGAVIEAIVDFDLTNLVNAVINVPGKIIDGVLNGTLVPNPALPLVVPGVLSTGDPFPEFFGPVKDLIEADQEIGELIAAPVTTAAADTPPDPDADTLTLATDTSVDADEFSAPDLRLADKESDVAMETQETSDSAEGEDDVTDTGEAMDDTSDRVEQALDTGEVTVATTDAIDENDSDDGADRDEATSARDTGDVDGSDDDAVTENQKTDSPSAEN
jgi:hypothetical protein